MPVASTQSLRLRTEGYNNSFPESMGFPDVAVVETEGLNAYDVLVTALLTNLA
jgi:hypothetical protein